MSQPKTLLQDTLKSFVMPFSNCPSRLHSSSANLVLRFPARILVRYAQCCSMKHAHQVF